MDQTPGTKIKVSPQHFMSLRDTPNHEKNRIRVGYAQRSPPSLFEAETGHRQVTERTQRKSKSLITKSAREKSLVQNKRNASYAKARLICVIVGRKQGLDVFNGFFELGSFCNPASSTSSKALLFFPFIYTCGVYYYGYVLKLGMGFDFPQCLDSAPVWHIRIEQN